MPHAACQHVRVTARASRRTFVMICANPAQSMRCRIIHCMHATVSGSVSIELTPDVSRGSRNRLACSATSSLIHCEVVSRSVHRSALCCALPWRAAAVPSTSRTQCHILRISDRQACGGVGKTFTRPGLIVPRGNAGQVAGSCA
jgi:hypothetical protein